VTTIHDLFPSRFLKASDLKGQRRVLTISKITSEEIGREKKRKPVVYFQKCTKGLPLNITNGRKIAEVVGSESITDWPGKQIALYSKPDVEYAGQVGPAIRVDYPTLNDITPRAADENSVPAFDDAAEISPFEDTGEQPLGSGDPWGYDDVPAFPEPPEPLVEKEASANKGQRK
jgi:hypothetical protein